MDEAIAEDRVEAYAAASFVLSVSILHDLVIDGLITRDRAARILESAIITLRRLYGVTPEQQQEAVADDVFNYARLSEMIARQEHERPAEDLLRSILDPLLGHGAPDVD